MPKIELLFFRGCPNVNRAREALRSMGITDFLEVDQGQLENSHPYLHYSSPTILKDGKLVAGSVSGSAACSIIDWNRIDLSACKKI
jgi:predicted thioredoxin/glutaredoxin